MPALCVPAGDVDWQIWIQLGDYPLPRKLVITTKTDEARPQHTSVFTWDLAPSYNDAAFTFVPPAGALRVALPGAAGTASNPKKRKRHACPYQSVADVCRCVAVRRGLHCPGGCCQRPE